MSTWCPFWLIFFWCGCLTKGEVNSEGTSHTKGKHWHMKLAGLRTHGPLWAATLNSKTIAVLPSFFLMSTVILWAFVWSCAPSAAQMLDKEQPQPLGWSKDAAWGVLLLQLSLASPSWTEGKVLGRVVQVLKILSHICLDKTKQKNPDSLWERGTFSILGVTPQLHRTGATPQWEWVPTQGPPRPFLLQDTALTPFPSPLQQDTSGDSMGSWEAQEPGEMCRSWREIVEASSAR